MIINLMHLSALLTCPSIMQEQIFCAKEITLHVDEAEMINYHEIASTDSKVVHMMYQNYSAAKLKMLCAGDTDTYSTEIDLYWLIEKDKSIKKMNWV